MNEGHGFSRATALALMRALAPGVRLSNRLWRTQMRRGDFALYVTKSVPQRLKPSSAQTIYGTAEAVPFVRQSLPQPLRGQRMAHVLSKLAN
jgi:hypothetical protein